MGRSPLSGAAFKRWRPNRNISRRLNTFQIAPGSNPLDRGDGRIEDLAADMRTAGMAVDDHVLYTIFMKALPAGYEVGNRNLASRDNIGRDNIIKVVRDGTTDFL